MGLNRHQCVFNLEREPANQFYPRRIGLKQIAGSLIRRIPRQGISSIYVSE
jgi:hypothetical protein